MAGFVSTTATLIVNAVDLSSRVKEVNLSYDGEAVDNTTMGTGGVRSNLAGLKNITLRVRFAQDYAASNVDATMFSLISGGVAVAIQTKPTSGAISTTNPEYQTTLLPTSYNGPVSGSVGAEAQAEAVFVSAGVALTRDTTP